MGQEQSDTPDDVKGAGGGSRPWYLSREDAGTSTAQSEAKPHADAAGRGESSVPTSDSADSTMKDSASSPPSPTTDTLPWAAASGSPVPSPAQRVVPQAPWWTAEDAAPSSPASSHRSPPGPAGPAAESDVAVRDGSAGRDGDYGTAGPFPSPTPSSDPKVSRSVLIGGLVAALVLAVGLGVGWRLRGQGQAGSATMPPASGAAGTTSSTDPTTSPTPTPTTTVSPTPTVSPEDAAAGQLSALRSASLATLVLDGRWVAQVASKSVGITDPLQTAQNGTHQFFTVDILAEHVRLQSIAGDPSRVLLLQAGDFGKHAVSPDGRPYWVTVVDLGFGSSSEVKSWCGQVFAALSPAARDDACAPRALTPPHS